jgi:CubicO group peptidase (beta-lactamase class C family)
MVVATGVDQLLERAVEAGEVPGVVALAADDAGVFYAGAFGKRVLGGESDMTLDSVVWIASMTKAVTSLAAMQLVAQGQVTLDEPLANRLPEIGEIQVLEGFDDSGAPKLRAPRRPITLRHLLTHTSGFAYDMWNADMLRYQQFTGIPGMSACKRISLGLPLVFDPGDGWQYGIGIDWVGQTVERLSGQSLPEYFNAHIFQPLGMSDTSFILSGAQRERIAEMHRRQPDNSLEVIPFETEQNPEFYMGGGGLYSTGQDYLRFVRMVLGNGSLDGARILEEDTFAEMNKNQIGELTAGVLTAFVPESSNSVEFFPGVSKKWGLAYMINTEEAPVGRGAGSLSWGGLANTYYWVEPKRRVAGIMLTQILPFADPTVLNLLENFERAIYASRS